MTVYEKLKAKLAGLPALVRSNPNNGLAQNANFHSASDSTQPPSFPDVPEVAAVRSVQVVGTLPRPQTTISPLVQPANHIASHVNGGSR